MRRDYVTLNVRHVGRDDETLPTVVLTVDEQTETLEQRLVTADGDGIEADRLDVVFRLKGPVEDDATGVFSLSDRITGEFDRRHPGAEVRTYICRPAGNAVCHGKSSRSS